MILLWGAPTDPPVRAVHDALARRRVRPLVLSNHELRAMRPDSHGGRSGQGQLTSQSGGKIDLAEIDSAYLRPDAFGGDGAELEAALALLAWGDVTRARVVNRPAAALSNQSKPYQLRPIRDGGFEVPDTLVTTDPDDVLSFWAQHGDIVFKSVSGVRSIVRRLIDRDRARLPDVHSCPTQFQQYVPGVDHRVHVIGGRIFAARIISAAIDYRYAANDGLPATIHAARLPDEVAGRCLTLTAALGLDLAGIDLRLSPDGRWWCFEVNTSPGFTWFEMHTGQPIAAAVADHLMAAV